MGLTAAQARQANHERSKFPAYAPSRPKQEGSPLRRAHADLRGMQPKVAVAEPGYFSCMPPPELQFDDYYGDAHNGKDTQRAVAARGEAFNDFYSGQYAGRDADLGPGMVPRVDAARGEAFADFYGDAHAGEDTESNFTVGTLPGMCGPAPTEESITSRLKIKPAPHAMQDGMPGAPRSRRDGTLTPKIGGGGGGLRGSPNMPASGRRHYVPFPAAVPEETPMFGAPSQQPMYAAPPQPLYAAPPPPQPAYAAPPPQDYALSPPQENYGRRALCTRAHEDGDVATSLTSYGGAAAAASHHQRAGGAPGGSGSPMHASVSQLEREARVAALRHELTATETQMTALHSRALELRNRLAQLGVLVPPS